jgi:hypothetical protein
VWNFLNVDEVPPRQQRLLPPLLRGERSVR